ncbi:uncharacterized protein LOC143039847 [Oratosquilla oratoria]|uniref:uncharacterized protein LOC143039847 n=1 Tax=Oratosquilla oratoria TaxID=337810 RepID=UPI003F7704B9
MLFAVNACKATQHLIFLLPLPPHTASQSLLPSTTMSTKTQLREESNPNEVDVLPVEIWERILECLCGRDLISAAQVSHVWGHLVARLCRLRCRNQLPPRLLEELQHEVEWNYSCRISCLDGCGYLHHHNHHQRLPGQIKEYDPGCEDTRVSSVRTWDPGDTGHDRVNNQLSKISNCCCEWSKREREKSPSPYIGIDSDQELEDCDWLAVYSMYLESKVTGIPSRCRIHQGLFSISQCISEGEYILMVSEAEDMTSSTVHIHRAPDDPICKFDVEGRVSKVHVLSTRPLIMALNVDKIFSVLLLQEPPPPSEPHLVSLETSLYLQGDLRMSICSPYLATLKDQVLRLYSFYVALEELQVILTIVKDFTVKSPICWSVWNGYMTVFLSSGHVVSYNTEGATVAHSSMHKDLRYPNPVTFANGFVFVSTLVSRTLLAYWHMDRGRDYWLIGDTVSVPGINLPEVPQVSEGNLMLAKARIGVAVGQEVTCLDYHRGLVICGTREGDLLVFKNYRNGNGIDWGVLEEMPYLHISVTSLPISRVTASFLSNFVNIVLRVRNSEYFIVTIPTIDPPPPATSFESPTAASSSSASFPNTSTSVTSSPTATTTSSTTSTSMSSSGGAASSSKEGSLAKGED